LSIELSVSQDTAELSFLDLDRNNSEQVKLSSRVIDDVQSIVWQYMQNAKQSSLYFVIGGKEDEHSEAPGQRNSVWRNILKRLISGNTANAFLIFLLLSFALFFIIGIYTVFVMIVFQLVYLFFSDRIAMNLGNVHPTAEQPLVTIVSVRSDRETLKAIYTYARKMLPEIREEIMKTVHVPTTPEERLGVKTTVLQILSRHGVKVSLNDIEIRTRNVYGIVQRVSTKFHRDPPSIVMQNSLVSNAAATGRSTKHSSIMITAGSLEDLNEEELESVIGHELGHVKGHDPIILFCVTSFEFFGRFFLWLPLFLSQPIIYFIVAFGAIFAVGKVLETRADTESAVVLGTPQFMASALAKIGLRQLYHEKYSPVAKIFDWFQFDPHPPIYFRVKRMSGFKPGTEVKHMFLVSLRDCIEGFLAAF
ncbi:MAG TPA: M48 family metalloprotease, partial [Nitrososphaerales archaeon]|nr:M48 family metalloprotease [Nitrososphaerales archaeon]